MTQGEKRRVWSSGSFPWSASTSLMGGVPRSKFQSQCWFMWPEFHFCLNNLKIFTLLKFCQITMISNRFITVQKIFDIFLNKWLLLCWWCVAFVSRRCWRKQWRGHPANYHHHSCWRPLWDLQAGWKRGPGVDFTLQDLKTPLYYLLLQWSPSLVCNRTSFSLYSPQP